MVDIASLGFGIDSTPLVRSHEALDMLAQRARAADQSVQGFGQQVSLANSGFVTFNSGLGTATTHLSQMAASLQTVIGHLQLYRREIDLSAASFENFGKARDRVEALATSLGTSALALESFSRQSAVVGMTSLETAGAVQRVTAAIEGQTAAGRQLREVMQDYGVVLTGMSASNADQVLARFIDQARQYRATPGNTRVVNEVLGPLSVEATTSILNPGYEPVEQRRARIKAETTAREAAEMMDSATQVIRDTRRNITELADLRRHYNVRGLSQDQLGEAFQGMGTGPLSMQDPRNELEVLRHLERFGTEDQRRAAALTDPLSPGKITIPDHWRDAMAAPFGGAGDPNMMMFVPNAVSRFFDNRMGRDDVRTKMSNVIAQSELRREQQDGYFGRFSDYLDPQGGMSRLDVFRESAAGTLLFGGASTLFGGDPTVPLTADTRALSAHEVARGRGAVAQRVGEYGISEPARFEAADARLRSLTRGERGATQNQTATPPDALMAIRDGFIMPTGERGAATQGDIGRAMAEARPRYDNLLDSAQAGRDDAMRPGADHLRQLDMERWLQSVPPAQRGLARSLMTFGQSRENGVSTRQWASRGLSPDQILSDDLTGAGAMSPAQIGSFKAIRAGEDETYVKGVGESTQQQIALQDRIREALDQGGAAVERVTAKWQAHFAALNAGRSPLQTTADETRALTLVMQRQQTAAEQQVATLRRQNREAEGEALDMASAGYDPVGRRTAALEASLSTDIIRQKSAGTLAPGYEDERRRGAGVSAVRGADDIRAQTEAMVDQQRRVTQAAGARADVQARLASDMQVEAQFVGQMAQARLSKDESLIRSIEAQIAKVKELNGVYAELKLTAGNIQFGADAEWRAGVKAATAGMTPEQQRVFDGMRPLLDANRISPTEFLPGSARERGRQYDPYFGQASAITGGRLPPEVFAAMAYRESSMLADPPNAGGVPGVRGMMQFDAPTARENGLLVGDGVDERLLPSRAIPAAGQMLGKEMNRLGISGRVTDMGTMYRLLERYGMVKRGEKLPAEVEALFEKALQGQSVDAQTGVTNLMGGAFPGGPQALSGVRDEIAANQLIANRDANQDFAVQQARSSAILRLTAAGGGDFGRRLASAMVVDPRSMTGPEDASRRVRGEISSRQEGIASQTAGLEETARGANELAEAYRRSREEGEAFERHMSNNALVSALRDTAKVYPQVAKEIEGMAVQLERLNPLLDRAAANQAAARFQQGVRRDERQGEFYQADIDAGWWASASRRGEERARVQARHTAEDTKNAKNEDGTSAAISEEKAYKDRAAIERQRELGEETRNTRQEFDRLKISAMSAFEGAVLGGKDLSGILQALGQDLARFAMRIGPERLLMKGLESGVDWIGGAISDAVKGDGNSAGGAVASAGFSAATDLFSWFGADGLVISNGVPHRNAASGMLLNRPTTFMAQGGTVTAGEVNDEAIFPLKRDASGNLGIRAAGGGPSIVVNAPITVEGGAAKGGQGGGMEPAAMAQMQRDLERTINQAVRNSIANERRDGGDLYI